jgi:YfiR/HmsC-like
MKLNHQENALRKALPLLLAATCSTDAEEFPLNHGVKASYLLNLLRFIEWPSDVFGADPKLNLCIYGATSLDAFYALHGEHIGDRTISVERAGNTSDRRLAKCHILVVSGEKPLLSVPIARGMLTVGEADGFTARGGMINLLLIGGRVRFELNEEMAQACGFTIDPKLARLRVPSWYSARVG